MFFSLVKNIFLDEGKSVNLLGVNFSLEYIIPPDEVDYFGWELTFKNLLFVFVDWS